jgi:TonB-dependent receptor
VMAESQFAMQDVKYNEPMAVDLAPLNGYVSKLQPLNYEVDEEVLAAFIQSDLNWTSRLSTVVGVRTEVTSQSYEHDVSFEASNERYWNLFPSFHATYRMSRINVRFALTSGLSRPEYTRLLPAEGVVDGKFILGNPDLKPVRSYGADLLLEMYPQSLSVFSCGLFAKRLLDSALDFRFEREIAGVSFTAFEPVNGESGYVAGAEASAVHHLASTGIHSLRHFGTYANYGFARSRIDYGNIRLGDGPMLNSARHTDNLGLFYDNPRVSFTVSYTYRSPLLRTVSADPRDDVWWQSEHRADASVKVDLTRQAQLFLKANNLTNETQREVYGDPYDLRASPLRFRKREEYGRTALVGLAYSL